MKKIKIREIRDWLRGLEENKWRKTYIVDAKRIAHFARNIVNDCNDPLPSYLSRKEGFSYSRAKQLAEKYVAKLREEEEQENQIRQEVRKIAKSILLERRILNEYYTKALETAKKEVNNKYILIAYNESHWSWEYDTSNSDAFLFVNKLNGSLILIIVSTRVKSGLGAGEWYDIQAMRTVGELIKPDMNTIKSLLKKYSKERSRAGYPYTLTKWYDVKDNKQKSFKEILQKNKGNVVKYKMRSESYDRIQAIIQDEIRLMEKTKQLESDEELENSIKQYMTLKDEVEDVQAQIEEQLEAISSKQGQMKELFSMIKKYMERFDISKKEVDQWIAKLESVLKYKVARPDYKGLWNEAVNKVNTQTKKVLADLMNAQLEIKKKEKTLDLTIEASLKDIVKSILSKFKDLFKSITGYEKVAKTLPKIK